MLLAILSMLSMAIATLILGYLLMHFPFLLITPIWYSAGCVAAFAVIGWRKHIKRDTKCFTLYKKDTIPMLFWGVLNGICWFLSIYLLGVSGNLIIARFQIVIALILGVYLYKEEIDAKKIILCGLICAAGLIFAVDMDNNADWLGIILSIINSISVVAFNLHQKNLSGHLDSLYVIMLRAGIIAVLTASFVVIFEPDMLMKHITAKIVILCVIGGVLSAAISHYFTTKAFKTAYFSTVSLIKSSGIIITFLASVFILGEGASPAKWIAAAIAITATILLTLANKKTAPILVKED